MEKITEMHAGVCSNSNYVKPFRLFYKQDGKHKIWDIIKVHASVSVIIFNISRSVLVFVKQFRPAVYYHSIPEEDRTEPMNHERYPASLGITLELCAGIVDKKLPLEEIAREEILEECGYNVPVSCLEKVGTFRAGVGVSGERQTMFYAEVTDEMKVTSGGGNASEGECIDVVEMTIPEIRAYLKSDEPLSTSGFFYALTWFLTTKAPAFENKSTEAKKPT